MDAERKATEDEEQALRIKNRNDIFELREDFLPHSFKLNVDDVTPEAIRARARQCVGTLVRYIQKHVLASVFVHWYKNVVEYERQAEYRKGAAVRILRATLLRNVNNRLVSRFVVWRRAANLEGEARGHRAARIVQARWRGIKGRERFARRLLLWKAAMRVQASVRRVAQRGLYLLMKRKAIKLQSHLRRFFVRLEVLRMHDRAVWVQKAWRASKERKAFLVLREAAIRVQQNWRLKAAREMFLAMLALVAREEWRRLSAAINIQRIFRGYRVHPLMAKLRREQRRLADAALRIQKAWYQRNDNL